MDSSPPPSPTRQPVFSFSTDLPGTHDPEVNPHSFSDMIAGRPVSDLPDQPQPRHPTAIDDNAPPPSLTDVAPNRGHSYCDTPLPAGDSSRDTVARNQPLSIGDLAGDRGKSEYNDTEYENDRIPSQGDVRQSDHSSGYDDDYQMSSGPKSYNSDHFGKFKW
ncbi:hypothetical protein L1987_37330 [Smallanthus sonchifolius]|uniref:Uncharacterized protein n=1 Tax=Smallanthus sonchifolius TaxID=185202 RepID=A0ACB9HIL8_9ASTR|nr:hypothetical protein L1987_37330 [Smallanthus sonchifolius]